MSVRSIRRVYWFPPAVVEVVLVGAAEQLGLVPHQPHPAPQLGGHRALVAALPQQTVDSLHLVPALGSRHLGQEGGGLPGAHSNIAAGDFLAQRRISHSIAIVLS